MWGCEDRQAEAMWNNDNGLKDHQWLFKLNLVVLNPIIYYFKVFVMVDEDYNNII